jgi:hypothetical protein
MKMKKLSLLTCLIFLFITSFSQTSYIWNGSTSTNWNTNTNWTPNGIPGAIDNVTIVPGANNCLLPANITINNLTITNGLLNLNGFTINTTGVVACNNGSCNNGTFNSTATSLTFAGTTFGANITATVADIYFNGSVFNGSVTVTKTGATNNSSTGNNTFNNTTTLTNAGTGYLLLTNGGAGRNETFNGLTSLNTTNTGGLYIGYGQNVALNANLTINNTSSTGLIQIGRVGTVSLNSGVTITCGTFAGANLNLYKIVQTGSTAQSLSPGNAGSVNIYGSNMTGVLTINAGIITAQTSTFSSDVNYNVTGTTSNAWSSGGNTYNGILTINNTSSGYIGFANGTADTYNADVYANNTSTTGGRIIFGNNCTSQFNGNIYVSQSGTTNASGIAIGWGGTFPVINLASGKNILVNGTFSSGYLQILKMQAAVTSAINLTTTGTSNVQLNNNIFNGTVNVTAPDIYPYGGTYNAPVSFVKTAGGSGNHNNSNLNIFNSTLSIENQSNTGYFLLGYQSADQFNDNITVTSSGTGGISFGWSGGTGAPVLASGKIISIGAGGYSAGFLQFGSFTQLGPSTPINLTLTGTASFEVYKNTIPTTFNSALTITAPDVYLRGGTFNGTAEFTKTAGTSNHNNGYQNIFNSTCTINQQSTAGYFMLGYNSNDLFNGDIIVTNTGTQGVYFGWSSGTGTPTQSAGHSITVGGAGFSGGSLSFNTFTQLGNSPVNLNFTGTTTTLLFARNSVFNGDINSVTPSVFFNGCVFNGIVNSTKTGSNNDASSGGNTFNGISTFVDNGSGYLLFGNGSPDTWNATVNFTNNGSNIIYPCYNSVGNLFNGTINLNSSVGAIGVNFCAAVASTATLSSGFGITTGSYNGGYLILQRFTQLGTVAINLTLSSTAAYLQYGPSSALGGNVTSVSPGLFFHGCTFNGTTDCTKNGSSGDYSQGGNVFNGISNITNSGSSYLLLGNTNPDTWNSDVTFTNNGSERLLPCWATVGNLFNGNIYVNTSGSAQGIQFCGGNATATATLAATKTIAAGITGLNTGYLQLKQFTQLGNAPINLTLSSTATYLQYGPLSALGGNVTSVSPGLFFHGCTFNGTTDCTKNGSSGDYSQGGNIFNGISNITNSGSSYLLLGNTNPDTWNSDVTFTNNGSERLLPCWATVGNLFNGNIYVNTSGSAQGIQFCGGNATATATLAATKTIAAGTTGLNAGYLQLKQFTQLGNAPINLTLSSTATYLQYGPSSVLGGNVTSVSPGLYFQGCMFNGTSTCTKNGTTNDNSNGNNIFNGTSIMSNTGSGYLLFGNGNADQFNTTATFNNLGSSHIYVAYNSINNIFGGITTFNNSPTNTNSWIYIATASANNATFNDNIIVNCNNGAGIYFGNSTGTSTLSAGKTINIGAGGFNAGQLVLKQFTQVSATPQSLTTTGTSLIQYGPTSSFDGNVTSVSPGLFFQGCTFNGLATCTKNGTTNDGSIGNNIFNGTTIMNNTGSGYLLFGNGNRDQFNTTATFNNLGSSHIYVAYNSINNIFGGVTTFNNAPTSTGSWINVASYQANNSTFNNNIIVNCNNGAGIYFGNSTGTSTLSAGKTISIGAGGFNAGQLVLKQFTQVSATPQNITTTGSSLIQYGPTSSFDGDITSVSPGLFFNTSVFNGLVNSTKNGTTNDVSPGGNIFNGSTALTDVGTGAFYMANSTSDAYNGNVIFTQNNTGIFYPNHNTNCTYAGNITVNSAGTYTITFGQAAGGIATLTGGVAQTINKTGAIGNPVFTRLIINKSASDVTLNTRANVSTYLTLMQGIVNTTQTNILNMNNASTTTIGNALSFINGPMNYDMALNGSRTLNFPVGKIGPVLSGTATVITADWRPAILNSVHNNGTSYTYNTELFISSADALGWAMPATVANVSRIHWWDIARTNTSTGVITPTLNLNGNQTITLYYDVNDGVTDPTNLTICKNTYTATTAWKDIGGSGATMTTGNVTSSSAPTAFNSFSRFTLGNRIGGVNPLPIELLYFTATPINNEVNLDWATATETNNDYYIVEKSIDGINFEYVTKVKAYGNGNSTNKQSYHTLDENPYKGLSYYRLKQVDKTSDFKYANIVSVELKENSYINIYPNPATDKLYINASNNYNNSSIKIISATGVEVKSAEQLISYNGIIDLADLASGMYFIVINDGTSIQNIKISIQK